jgi:predicted MPP superfamily phosphohydrolase
VPDRVALTLCGHTHGGQIRMPFVWPAFVPSEYGARFAYGHIVEQGRHLIVSGGIGTSIIPMRVGVPPEILRVELGSSAIA